MRGKEKPNPKDLRVVKTARTETEINNAAREGFWPLVKPVVPSKQIHHMLAVYQHRETGEIVLSGDFRWPPGEPYQQVVPYTTFYPYHFPSPFAAYLVPPDLAAGELVWIEDLIEDLVAVWGNQGYHPRLASAEAVWTGKDFEIQFDPEKDAGMWIG